ncbi:Diguanylate cyclase [Candidatus Magnetomoraceae bacterium gMMP-15]
MSKTINYFKSICKVTRAFGTTLNTDELLNLIVESAIDTMDGKAACIFLADEERNVFVPAAQKGLSENYLHAEREEIKDILDKGYLAIKDAVSDPRTKNHKSKKAEGIASILVVPVMVKGKAIGALSLYTSAVRDFSQHEIDFLNALAEHGGMAVQNTRLFERINENSRLFFDLASNINSSLDIKKILHILTAEISEALKAKGAIIWLLNEDTGLLDVVASYGLSEKFLNKGPLHAEKYVVKVLDGEVVIIKNVKAMYYKNELKEEGITSLFAVPINVKDEVIGIMNLFFDVEREFYDDTIMLVRALANQGGLAIQNASMYLTLQEDKESLEKDIWSHKMWF